MFVHRCAYQHLPTNCPRKILPTSTVYEGRKVLKSQIKDGKQSECKCQMLSYPLSSECHTVMLKRVKFIHSCLCARRALGISKLWPLLPRQISSLVLFFSRHSSLGNYTQELASHFKQSIQSTYYSRYQHEYPIQFHAK